MMSLLQQGTFVLDAVAVTVTAWLLVRCFASELPSVLEQWLAWGLGTLLIVAASGVILGFTGGLGQPGFLGIHLLLFGALAAGRRDAWRADLAALGALRVWRPREGATPRLETFLVALLLLVAAVLLIAAFATQPVVFDALTYRLSRAGHWLQEGRIAVIGGDDARLNYMPVVPDLVMAWLMTGSTSGYGAVAVAQALGGLLALGATVGLARTMGVGRTPALAAACLLLGLPNVAPQFTAAYTDLFTTGVLSAGFFLWLAAARRGAGSCSGGLAAGLALGSKGTVIYFAPGLLVAVGWLAWRHRLGRPAWTRTILGAGLAVAVFVLPGVARNFQAYGGPFGPEEFVLLHHGRNPGLAGSIDKLRLNLSSALVQLLEPNSQLTGWRGMTRSLGESLMSRLPEQDPYAFQGLNRRAELRKIYAIAAPDADVTSTGVLVPLLGLAAAFTSFFRRKSADGELALIWSVAIAGFVLFLHWRVQWHPYLFRFLGLAAPWLAALVVWWIQLLPWRQRAIAWIVTVAATLSGFGGAMFNTYQSGWPAIANPGQSTGYYVYAGWRAWSGQLDHPGEPLRPALSVNSPLAAFYRQQVPRRILPQGLAALPTGQADSVVHAGGGWVIVPVAQYLGREGRVMGRTWLYDGDERHPYSIAAFRALEEGEQPVPLVYRDRTVEKDGIMQHGFLVRTWAAAPLHLELFNPGRAPCHFAVMSPLGGTEGDLKEGARLVLEVPLPPDTNTLLTVDFSKPSGPTSGRIEARLVP